MGDLMSSLGNLGTDVMQGFQGAGQALGDITGFSGGGGPLSPGTLNSIASNFAAAPNVSLGIPDISAAVPAAASAASAMAAPGDMQPPVGGATISGGGTIPTGTIIPSVDPNSPTLPIMDAGTQHILSSAPISTTIGALSPGINVDPTSLGGSGWLQGLLKDPKMLAALVPAAATLMGATQKPPGLKDIQNLEAQQAGLAKNQGELALGEQAGMLPAGMQNAFQRELDANLATIRANYQARGLTGSSSEAQDLQAARLDVQDKINKEAENLATGSWKNYSDATKYQSDLLDSIMKAEVQQQADFRKALADMAAAFTK